MTFNRRGLSRVLNIRLWDYIVEESERCQLAMGGVDSKAMFKEAVQDLANKEQVIPLPWRRMALCAVMICWSLM